MDLDLSSLVDDFFVNMSLQTTLALPHTRETILHFCEAVQKEFPEMTSFFQREAEEYVLEGNRETGRYEWLELHPRRMTAGSFNPHVLCPTSTHLFYTILPILSRVLTTPARPE